MTDCIEPAHGTRDKDGYIRVNVKVPGRKWHAKRLAHRLAYEAAFGPIPPGMMVCHICDNPPCINQAHLFLGTAQANVDDMIAKGRRAAGSRHPKAVLNEETATYALARIVCGESISSVSRAFGVARKSLQMLRDGKTWKHLYAEAP